MRITCPYCGPRGSEEYVCHGDATPTRPSSDDGWYEFVYLRANPKGRHRELWYHVSGCRSWLVVTRDTSTHEVVATELAREAIRDTVSQSRAPQS